MTRPVPAFVFSGVHYQLREGQSKVFGRSDYRGAPEKAQNISKRQFALSVVAGSLWVRILSTANPTKVLLAGQPPLVLSEGQQGELHPGDAVLLHALDPSQCIAIVCGQRQEPQQQEGGAQQLQQPQQQEGDAQQLQQPQHQLASNLNHEKEQGQQQQRQAKGVQQDKEQGRQQQQQQAKSIRQEEEQGRQQQQQQPANGAQRKREQSIKLDLTEDRAKRPRLGNGNDSDAGSRQGTGAVMEEAVAAAESRPAALAAATTGQPSQQNQQLPPLQQPEAAATGGEMGNSHPSQASPSQAGPSTAQGAQQPARPSPSEDASGPARPVVLILVGVQGSGKSTFANRLIGASQQEWVRINQDSVNSGKRGNKEMCISAARSALAAGRHVIVDRTNIDPAQRQAFIELARQCGAKAHCMVLRLPLKTCQARAAGREKHEGGLQGKAAYAAVNIMHSNYMKAGPPSEAEGSKTVLMCENDEEVDAALRTWSGYGSAHRDPLGTYRQLAPLKKEPSPEAGPEKKGGSGKSKGPVVKPGGPGSIESFFKKKPAPAAAREVGPMAKEGPRSGKVAQGDAAGSQVTQPGAASGGTTKEAQGQEQKGKAAAVSGAKGRAQQAVGASQQAATSSKQQQPGLEQPAEPPQQQQGPSQPAQPQQQRQQQQRTPPAPQPSACPPCGSVPKGNALQLMMEKAKEKKSPPASSLASAPQTAGASGPSQPSHHTFPSRAPALRALMDVAAHPERHSADPAFACDDRCVRISDKYAKARFHALVIARDPRLQGPLDLRRQDVPLVQHMLAVGREWAEQQRFDGGEGRPDFFFGFHSVPSMRQLHLHVISQDLVSAAMKNKKHWNSFNAPFFLHAPWVLSELEQRGQLDYDLKEREELLKSPLKCHRCGAGAANMPQLKSHIAGCRSPVQGP